MYANLRVVVNGETHAAWKVEITYEGGERRVVVHLDGNDGNGNYAEPAGTLEIAGASEATISADW